MATRASTPARASASYEDSASRFAGNAVPWIGGIYGVMVLFVYREIFRLMFWARSMNW